MIGSMILGATLNGCGPGETPSKSGPAGGSAPAVEAPAAKGASAKVKGPTSRRELQKERREKGKV